MALKPSWRAYYQLGKETAKELDAFHTFEQIGAEFGITKQQAYQEAMVALGKLVYQLKKIYCNEPVRGHR